MRKPCPGQGSRPGQGSPPAASEGGFLILAGAVLRTLHAMILMSQLVLAIPHIYRIVIRVQLSGTPQLLHEKAPTNSFQRHGLGKRSCSEGLQGDCRTLNRALQVHGLLPRSCWQRVPEL